MIFIQPTMIIAPLLVTAGHVDSWAHHLLLILQQSLQSSDLLQTFLPNHQPIGSEG
jgi:hypothetical protein